MSGQLLSLLEIAANKRNPCQIKNQNFSAKPSAPGSRTLIQKFVPDVATSYPLSWGKRMSEQNESFDVVVVGGGSGGYAAARTAKENGKSVAVVEGGDRVGGLCILRGCMPTKALLYAAEVAHLSRSADTWGIQVPTISPDLSAIMARKDALIDEFARYREEQLRDGRFTLIRDVASFCDPYTLELKSGKRIKGKHFVIATGSKVSPPPLPDLNEVGYLTSDDLLELKQRPESLIVLGGGAVAVELAQFYQRIGTQVTLVQRSETILKEFDQDAATEVQRALEAEGMKIYTQTELLRAERCEDQKSVTFRTEAGETTVTADEIFMALGRSPNTAELNLTNIGVDLKNGRIQSDSQMRTSVPHIFAAGDCTGPHEVVHIAIQQGELAAHNICHPEKPRDIDYRLLTSIVLTDPQLAQTGLSEKAAKALNQDYHQASYPFNDHGKSMIMNAQHGFVKLLANPKSGEILGGTCVGPVGGELIHEITVAMAKRMTAQEFAAIPHYHPTLAEIWTYPAEDLAELIKPSQNTT